MVASALGYLVRALFMAQTRSTGVTELTARADTYMKAELKRSTKERVLKKHAAYFAKLKKSGRSRLFITEDYKLSVRYVCVTV
jgi:hypothetical protein